MNIDYPILILRISKYTKRWDFDWLQLRLWQLQLFQFLRIVWKLWKLYFGEKNWRWLNGIGPKRGILTLLEAMAHPVYCTIHISVVYSCAHAYHKHLNFKNYQILSKKCQNLEKIMKFPINNKILENFNPNNSI